MIPRLHPKGHSFKGAAAYLLHDKKADTTERVAWAETRNLSTDKPEVAWQLMAATALSQDELKAEAGIKNTGRKSSAHVLHFSLSWTADEAKGLTREEMLRAAHGALRALSASDRQAIIVSHNDEPHPHVHILLNRVSPEDGRMLSSSKEKLVLSQWAESYERERGEILCEERVINNAARNRKEFTRGDGGKPRHVHELEVANDGGPRRAWLKAQEKLKDAALARQTRELQERQRQVWDRVQQEQRQRIADIRAQTQKTIAAGQLTIRAAHRPLWATLFQQHEAQLRDFRERESRLFGRIHNTLNAIDFAAIVRSGDRRNALSEAFKAITSEGARTEALRHAQLAEGRALAAKQMAMEKAEADRARAVQKERLARVQHDFLMERDRLIVTHSQERIADRDAWRGRRKERLVAWQREPFRLDKQRRNRAPSKLQQDFSRAAQPIDPARADNSDSSGGARNNIVRSQEAPAKVNQTRRTTTDQVSVERTKSEETRRRAFMAGQEDDPDRTRDR